MRLLRITLRNFRGVTDRTVEFPASGQGGVVVLHGNNEIGKSSLIEALDLLLEEKDTSTKAAVRAVQPVNADVGTSVEAELTVGDFRFIYRKQFNRGHETVLTMSQPVREHLSGPAAHDRVREILGGAVDLSLWKALRILQSDTQQPELSHSSVLSEALDRAAGTLGGEAAAGQPVLDAVLAEAALYFTPTGRPTGVLRNVDARLEAARAEVVRTSAALTQVDDEVAAHDAIDRRIESLRVEADDAEAHLDELRARTATAERLRTQWRVAAEAVETARIRLQEAERRQRERLAVVDELDRHRRVLDDLDEKIGQLESALAEAELQATLAFQALTSARATAESARERLDLARADADHLREISDAADLKQRCAAIRAATQELSVAEGEVTANPVDDATLAQFEKAATELASARARQEAGSAHVDVLAHGPIDATGVEFPIGKRTHLVVDRDIELVVAGRLEIAIRPGADAAALAEAARQAEAALSRLHLETGIESLSTARTRHHARIRAVEQAASARQRAAQFLRGATLDALARDLATLETNVRSYHDQNEASGRRLPPSAAVARERLTAAVQQERSSRTSLADAERTSAQTTARFQELSGQHGELRRALAAANSLLTAATARHDEAVAEVATAELTDQALQARAEAKASEATEHECRVRWNDSDSSRLPADLAAAEATVNRLHKAIRAAELELESARSRLQFLAELGRQEDDDAARTELVAAEREHRSVTARAEAAQLLLRTLQHHQLAMKTSYVEPFRHQLVRLGRLVFGDDFDVAVDADLRVVSRSWGGLTIPFPQLSTGAREQLSLLVRLAAAAVIDPADGVPVFFDDALGHSDPDRLAAMSQALAGLTSGCQVILLTGNPERYRGLRGAHFLPITAEAAVTVSVPFGRHTDGTGSERSVLDNGRRADSARKATATIDTSPSPGGVDRDEAGGHEDGVVGGGGDRRRAAIKKAESARRPRPASPTGPAAGEAAETGLFELSDEPTAINT